MLIGVYGTLKKGFGNHFLLKGLSPVSVDFVKIDGITGVGFPKAEITGRGNRYLQVEIYSVNDEILKDLDRLEGHPDWYHRVKTKTVIHNTSIEVYSMPNIGDALEGDIYTKQVELPTEKVVLINWGEEVNDSIFLEYTNFNYIKK